MKKTVFITGASSGLGKQMAIEFARRGYRLALTARRGELLAQLQSDLIANYQAEVHTRILDVLDFADINLALQEAAAKFSHIDIVIANAGVGYSEKIGRLGFDKVKQTIDTNVLGVMATIDAAVQLFETQGSGHLVAISSVAAFRGMPYGAAYSASKAAVSTYVEALRAELYYKPIDVTLLSPGYIDTPINQAARSRPFCIDVERGGKILVDRIEAKVKHATVPRWPWAIVARLLSWLPTSLVVRI